MGARLERLVEIALRDVLDPEMGRSVVDLGLIYAIEAAPDGSVAIAMTTTTRGEEGGRADVEADYLDCALEVERHDLEQQPGDHHERRGAAHGLAAPRR